MKTTTMRVAVLAMLSLTTTLSAQTFYKSGIPKRILTDGKDYGKCMVQLPVSIGSGCSSSWVSLDCEGKYLDKGDGDRMLNVALIAQNMNKKISIKVDTSKKYGGFCVGTRLDLLK